jgi:hypothetical protein
MHPAYENIYHFSIVTIENEGEAFLKISVLDLSVTTVATVDANK